jgi:hypothetical protein
LLVLFVALSLAHTWPLAADLAHHSRFDNADANLNAWTITWVAHAAFRDPAHLFDANIFHPERNTLAYSEHLVLQGVMAAPLLWLGASPLLAFNVILLAGLALTGWTTSLVLTRWTGSTAAGVLAGSLVAFNTHVFTRLAHLQAVHVEFLPVAFWALDRVLARGRLRDGFALAASFTAQALCSGYLLVLTAVGLVAAAAARPVAWLRPTRSAARTCGVLALAALLSAIALWPFLVPYARLRATQGLVRSIEEVARYSASPADYLTTVSRLHYGLWSWRLYEPGADALFPGVLAILLAAWAIVEGTGWRDPRARTLLAAGVAGFALSFGPALPGYEALHRALPVFQGLRGAARFGYLAMIGVAGLSAFGLARLQARVSPTSGDASPWRRRAVAVGVLAVAVATAEAWTAPFEFTRFGGIPQVYQPLLRDRSAVVVELPFPPPEHVERNAHFVLAAAYHLRPLVNGYSGFTPPSYARNARAFAGFPDSTSLQRLRELGVTHLVVHFDGFEDPAVVRRTLDALFDVQAAGRDVALYRMRR